MRARESKSESEHAGAAALPYTALLDSGQATLLRPDDSFRTFTRRRRPIAICMLDHAELLCCALAFSHALSLAPAAFVQRRPPYAKDLFLGVAAVAEGGRRYP